MLLTLGLRLFIFLVNPLNSSKAYLIKKYKINKAAIMNIIIVNKEEIPLLMPFCLNILFKGFNI
jgi:hypothetical protein